MQTSASCLAILRSHGLSVDLDRFGKLHVYPRARLAGELSSWIRDNRDAILRDLWSAVQARTLASLPEAASGLGMTEAQYLALLRYIAQAAPIRLVDYHCGIGNVIRVTPPRDEVPAGTITMVCDTGSHVDGDSRCFTYPDGTPVADEYWGQR